MRCDAGHCARGAWGGTKFCFFHLYRWAFDQLTRDEQRSLSEAVSKVVRGVGVSRSNRLIFILSTFEQFSPREVGATLDLAPTTIMRTERRILEILPNTDLLDLLRAYYPLLRSVASREVATGIMATNAELFRFVARDSRRLRELSSREFERVVGEIMKSFGFSVELTAETRDGGYDLIALKYDIPNVPTRFIVECKRYSAARKVGVRLVRELYGVKEELREPNAILVATTEFTKSARGFAESVMKGDVRPLHLVGFRELSSWLETTGRS